MSENKLKNKSKKEQFSDLWKLTRGYRFRYFSAALLQGISILCKSGVYLLLAWFIDAYLSNPDDSLSILQIAFYFIALSGGEALFSFLNGYQYNYIAENIARNLRDRLYDQIQRMTFAFHSKADSGDLILRATSDMDAVRLFFSEQTPGIWRVVFLYVVNFSAILKIDRALAGTTLILIPMILITAMFFFQRIGKIYEDYQNQDAIVSSMLQENLTGMRVVKAFARQDYEIAKYEAELRKRYEISKKLAFSESLFWPASDALCGIQLIVSYLLGASFAIDGRISLGDFIAFQALLTFIVWPMRNLGRMIVRMSRSLVSFGRIAEILDHAQEEIASGKISLSERPNGAIEFRHVSFAYENGKNILEDLSFSIAPGQSVAIIGSTGSGKTTLVNLLPRFFDYSSGHIFLDGQELNQITRESLRKHIAIVEQEPFLFSRSIRDNIAYDGAQTHSLEEIQAAAKAAAIHDAIMSFKNGYDTIVGERGVTLSGGQKQRIAIARAFLKNPAILILDDSLSAVDTDTEAQIQTALQQLMKNRVTLIIASRLQSAMNADLILTLDNGRIAESGVHSDLCNAGGLYQKIFEIQMQIEQELQREVDSA